MNLEEFNIQAQKQKKSNKEFYTALKKGKVKDLDTHFHKLHNHEFEKTDCLACANCCKTTSPIFYQTDIERAAKGLKVKPGDFIKTYLEMDEEGDFVFKSAPCPFLQQDNRCKIYKYRPTACKEYPHTDRKNMHQILDLTFRNTLVCPAVLNITEKLKTIIT